MSVAHIFAQRATCSRSQVGVVIARDGRVLSTGYNGAPAGMPHCDHNCDCPAAASPNYDHMVQCNSIRPCMISIHAEANAIAYAARFGVKVEGAELYTTFSPCLPCSQLIVASGITRVYYWSKYRDPSGLQLLEDAGIDTIALI